MELGHESVAVTVDLVNPTTAEDKEAVALVTLHTTFAWGSCSPDK